MYTLCLDLAGPFKQGSDHTGAAKYAVVGVYTYPQFWKQGQPVTVPTKSTEPKNEVDSRDPVKGDQGIGSEEDLIEPPVPESLNLDAVTVPEDHPIPDDFSFEDPDIAEDLDSAEPLDPKELDFTKTSELKWRTITKAKLEPLPALHFPMVVPVFHKGQKSVLRAVQQMWPHSTCLRNDSSAGVSLLSLALALS